MKQGSGGPVKGMINPGMPSRRTDWSAPAAILTESNQHNTVSERNYQACILSYYIFSCFWKSMMLLYAVGYIKWNVCDAKLLRFRRGVNSSHCDQSENSSWSLCSRHREMGTKRRLFNDAEPRRRTSTKVRLYDVESIVGSSKVVLSISCYPSVNKIKSVTEIFVRKYTKLCVHLRHILAWWRNIGDARGTIRTRFAEIQAATRYTYKYDMHDFFRLLFASRTHPHLKCRRIAPGQGGYTTLDGSNVWAVSHFCTLNFLTTTKTVRSIDLLV